MSPSYNNDTGGNLSVSSGVCMSGSCSHEVWIDFVRSRALGSPYERVFMDPSWKRSCIALRRTYELYYFLFWSFVS